MVSAPSGDFDTFSPPGWSVFTVSLPVERLNHELEARGLGVSPVSLMKAEVVHSDRQAMGRLRKVMRRVRSTVDSASETLDAEARMWMEGDVLDALVDAIAAGEVRYRPARRVRRPDLVQSTKAIIEENPGRPLTVSAACQVLRVSPHILRQAFLEHAGVSPQSYIKAQRLHIARRLLRGAPPGTRVAQVANQIGFWHMGQFAADYRRQFGELPSESLASAEQPQFSRTRQIP